MAACLAKGETEILNAAREPEVTDLGECLVKMGAEIEGLGTDRITVRGVAKLHGAEHSVLADRIEAGTYAIAAAITGGALELVGARADHLSALSEVLHEAGVEGVETARGFKVARSHAPVRGVAVFTEH